MKYIYLLVSLIFLLAITGCSSSDDDIRVPDDIMGVWQTSPDSYIEFSTNNEAHRLVIFEQDGETIGDWFLDVYFYEPGYNLVIYIDAESNANVYQVVSLSDYALTWCWVDEIHYEGLNKETIGQIIGQIINKAQEGYHLNPELYESFRKVSYDKFFQLLESLDIMYPWSDY